MYSTERHVKSIWVDVLKLDGSDYATDSAVGLLGKALKQLRDDYEFELITCAPSGIFGAKSSTALWAPAEYLDDKNEIQSAAELYRPIYNCGNFIPMTNGSICLRRTDRESRPLSCDAEDCKRYLRDHNISRAYELSDMMRAIRKDWSRGVCYRVDQRPREASSKCKLMISKVEPFRSCGNDSEYSGQIVQKLEEEAHLNPSTLNAISKFMGQKSELPKTDKADDPLGALYAIGAYTIGLDHDSCNREGRELRLMIHPEMKCISMFRRSVLPETPRGQQDKNEAPVIRTVKVSNRDNEFVLYEVMHVPGTFKPEKYQVFGVWFPMKPNSKLEDHMFAIAKKDAKDALII
ncbi:uncharacterized protein BO97DRAFT_429907 [Aspergillus homomorphus CBS 101889]|uniref:Heterokaryon incompatibility domain-containing protein n=1 Tax=Aspergillus homomorphus (strain CBS 101889) TaxID=1450537 RepID=A0A395HFY4_ASPHC|nr:hypothetical protein BO97DRAFT_429907 [Aspergillus homomorphus CBS 101889]RAL06812.1 hypothetical protein BO97DRAFT_429907 [Aspergillus homomorphus CBS 101889]